MLNDFIDSKTFSENANYLCDFAISNKNTFLKKLKGATDSQLFLILQCLKNFKVFSKCFTINTETESVKKLQRKLEKLNKRSEVKQILTKNYKLVRSVLAEIFYQVSMSEFCIHFHNHGASNESD